MNRTDAAAGFRQVFDREPALVCRAPGRVNLIGEHTDYNDGFVMPAAIDFATWTAIASPALPTPGRVIRVHAGNRNETVAFDLDAPPEPGRRHWSDYVRGIAFELERDGLRLAPADLWFAGDVPHGAGLSSSAALEMSVGLALLLHSRLPVDPAKLALAGQRAEHHFAGTKCGIMDQFISAHARAGHALMLDCRSLQVRHLPLPASLRLVICDTGVKHELAGGEYNVRRAQCEQGVAHLRRFLPEIRALRDVSPDAFEAHRHGLPDLVQRRCRHVIHENNRVLEFAAALEAGDVTRLGPLMAASHASLRDDYQVSCVELDQMVEAALRAPGILGTRMTGGGFGGCTVNLVEARQTEAFRRFITDTVRNPDGQPPRVFVTEAAAGAGAAADADADARP